MECKVTLADMVEMLGTIRYSKVEEIKEGQFYKALNPFGEERIFGRVDSKEEGFPVVTFISSRNLTDHMKLKKDIQTFAVDFISDDGNFKIEIHDYVVGKDIKKFFPLEPSEEIDAVYGDVL